MENPYSAVHTDGGTIDFQRILGIIKRGIWLLLLAFLLGGGVAYLVSTLQTPIYSASTQVILARPSSSQAVVGDITQALSSQQVAQTYVALLSQPWVMDEVSKLVGGGDIPAERISITAVTNTQIIDIEAEDADPARATLIANTLVQVLIEQNEALQSGRYIEAEKNLDTQIDKANQQIMDTQAALKLTQANALTGQIENTKTNIQNTQTAIADLQVEITKLTGISASGVANLLQYSQNNQVLYQTTLDLQTADYENLTRRLADPLVQKDAILTANLQVQQTDLGAAINQTRQQIETASQEISWLTPYMDTNLLGRTLAVKNDELGTQQSLLGSYQKIYTDLLVTGRINGTTDEISNLEKNLSLYQQIYLNLLSSRETVHLNRMQNVLTVVQTNPALATSQPIRPRTSMNTLLGAFGGLILSVTALFLTDLLDTTLKTREDVERELNLPIMGYALSMETVDGEKEAPYVVRIPRSPAADALRSLRTNLEFIGVDKPLKSILISSPGASEGKTTIAANLAAVIAQGGKRVVLLDADFRRPRIHHEMGMSNRAGLSDVFCDRLTLTDVIQSWDGLNNLSVITSGGIPPNPAELLSSDKMRQILADLESKFDIVIVDSTPTIVTDSQLIAARVGGVLLVLWPGRTNADAARMAVEQYRRVGARLLGVVLNNSQPGQGYGSPYSRNGYYRYEQSDDGDKRKSRAGINLPWKRARRSPDLPAETVKNTQNDL